MPPRVRLRNIWLQAGVYLGYTASGAISLFVLPASIADSLSTAIGWAWAVLLTIGGALALVGVLSGRLVLKLAGLPLLASAMLGYGTVILARVTISHGANTLGSLVVVFLLYVLTGHLVHRWIEVRRLLRAGSSDEF